MQVHSFLKFEMHYVQVRCRLAHSLTAWTCWANGGRENLGRKPFHGVKNLHQIYTNYEETITNGSKQMVID